jgi:octaprenyl-diphosphate synthase
MTPDEIIAPVAPSMEAFNRLFSESLRSEVPLLDKVTHYVVKKRGKQVRPLFVFLSCQLFMPVNQKALDAALLTELLHNATIVHDDVVDDANERRGYFSVNALWKNKIAVLVGDYMLSKILLLSLDQNNTDLLALVARSVKEMSEGELLQMEKARSLDITEEIYFEVIRKKTASLIATCCEAGCVSSGRLEHREKMRTFGEKVGLAFQIKDDIFDLGSEVAVGKPTGNDIREQKMTLPIIYALQTLPQKDARMLSQIIKHKNNDSAAIKQAIQMVNTCGAIAYAEEKMYALGSEAKALLADLPDLPAKQSLLGLVDYTMNRTK